MAAIVGKQVETVSLFLTTINNCGDLPVLDNMANLQNVALTSLELLTVANSVITQELSDMYDIGYEEEGGTINAQHLMVHSLNVGQLDKDFTDSYEDDTEEDPQT